MLWLLLACTKDPQDTSAPPDDTQADDTAADTGPFDVDGDGSVAADDCDDLDPDRHPDADELPNGVDDDCDDRVDETGCTADLGAQVLAGFSVFQPFDAATLALGEITGLAPAVGDYAPDHREGLLVGIESAAGDSTGIARLDAMGTFVDWLIEPGTLDADLALGLEDGALVVCSQTVAGADLVTVAADGSVSTRRAGFGPCGGMVQGDAGEGVDFYVTDRDAGTAFGIGGAEDRESLGIVSDLEGLAIPAADSAFTPALYGIGGQGGGIYTWEPRDPPAEPDVEERPYVYELDGLAPGEALAFGSGRFGDHLYVLSWVYDRVQRLTPAGEVEDLVSGPYVVVDDGTPGLVFSTDGDVLWFANEDALLWRVTGCDAE